MINKIDATALKFNQACIIMITMLGYLWDQALLVLFVGVVLAVGTVAPKAALFKLIYLKIVKPLHILKANIIIDDPKPHQFAQGVGALFLLVSSIALIWLNSFVLGWVLAWIVIILAAVNLIFNFCAGCFVYYQLDRAGLVSETKGK